jgi:predicted MFS family arabinose efflux permease
MLSDNFRRRAIDGVTMFVVTALSLLLLVYVGYGEGKRTYEQFHIEKLTAQGRVVENAMETYLRAGLPMQQFVGFTTLAEPIVEDEAVDGLAVYDQAGRQVFLELDKTNPVLPKPSIRIRSARDKVQLDSGDGYYQVILPLRTRFETVGSVVVYSNHATVDQRLNASFQPLLYLVAALSGGFALFVTASAHRLARLRAPWLQIGYGLIFLAMSGCLVVSLASLYSDGVQGKARSAASTLSQRLHDVVEFHLKFHDLDGLEAMFVDFRRLNPEISEAALIIDGKILVDTGTAKAGDAWQSNPRNYEFVSHLTRQDDPRTVDLAVAVPVDLVYQRVEGSVRNFAALFVASAFLAGLFLQVASSMQRLAVARSGSAGISSTSVREESALSVVKPIFFLAVFLENLTYSFLPHFMQGVARESGLSLGIASLPFTLYYLSFAISLIPAGHLSDRYGPKSLIWGGLIISGVGMLSLTLPLGIVAVAVIRAFAGVGQGVLFIGIQAYILAVASPEKKTQGAAIIVFGFQGGMISGMAIGSLLVNYIHPNGVFLISAAIGFAAALYSLVLIPKDVARNAPGKAGGLILHRVLGDLGRVLRNAEFLKAMLLIGVPAKAVLTGIVTFALPLLLAQHGFKQEEIGQVIMMYGIGVVISSTYVSRVVDRTGRTDLFLFWGAVLSGGGLVMVGIMGSAALTAALPSTALMIVGVILVGIAHGFVNAPVITHVAHSRLSEQLGANAVTAVYRFVERIGHVFGPMLMGQCFLIWGESLQIITWSGSIIAVFGVLFIAGAGSSHRQEQVGGEITP